MSAVKKALQKQPSNLKTTESFDVFYKEELADSKRVISDLVNKKHQSEAQKIYKLVSQ